MSEPSKLFLVFILGLMYCFGGQALAGYAATLPYPNNIVHSYPWSVHVIGNIYVASAALIAAVLPAVLIVKIQPQKLIIVSTASTVPAIFITAYTVHRLAADPFMASFFYSTKGLILICINTILFMGILPLLVGFIQKHSFLTSCSRLLVSLAGRATRAP